MPEQQRAKQVSSAHWFEKHKDCEIKVSDLENVSAVKIYYCKQHGRVLKTSAKPGDPPQEANPGMIGGV